MHFLLLSYRGFAALLVGALVYNYYAALMGNWQPYTFEPIVYYIVAAIALAEPLFWAVTHLCGGILMGIAAGGIWDGIKLAVILGVGLGFSRLWPSVLACAAAIYAADGPLVYSIGGALLAGGLYGLDKAMSWMWHHAKPETSN